jgi:hypothetical protein
VTLSGSRADVEASSRRRTAFALAVSVAFVCILTFNLCLPTPRGVADNGDFFRISSAFSPGPVGLTAFPEPDDPSYRARFFRHFLRHWQVGPVRGRAQETSALLVYAPGRLLPLTGPPGSFDLTLNAFYVAVLLGATLFVSLRRLESGTARLSLAVIALLLSDADVAIYLSSFYQEAGAYAFTFVLVCLMHLLWERRRLVDLVLFTLAAMALAATKFPFTPSVLVVGLSVLVAWTIAVSGDRRRRAWALAAMALLVASGIVYFERVRDRYGKDVSYNFVFSGVLPKLAEEEREPFLASVGIPREHATLSGRSYYEPASQGQSPSLYPSLGNAMHTRAIQRLAIDHPVAFVHLVDSAFARTGVYDVEIGSKLGTLELGQERDAPVIDVWSRLRARFLRGGGVYLVAAALWTALLVHVWRSGARDLRLLYAVTAAGCWAGSVGQVLIAILGNGPMDLNKHLWFGNVLLDLSLVLAVFGVGEAVRMQRGARPARVQSAS